MPCRLKHATTVDKHHSLLGSYTVLSWRIRACGASEQVLAAADKLVQQQPAHIYTSSSVHLSQLQLEQQMQVFQV